MMDIDKNDKTTGLYQRLLAYKNSDYYPYHMPGHKRKPLTPLLERVADLDITEIDGFDNLHQAQGILKEIQQHAARVYGAEETFYLINGSTAGVLGAVCTAVPENGHLLMARHSHQSAYHGAYLQRAHITYLYADKERARDINGAITPEQVENALITADRKVDAVLIVSPTYEGVVSDVRAISKVVHSYGIPLIVDEAHGAHLGFHPAWAPGSNSQGADLVVHSLHKTLPSMTQTALLHVNGKRIDRKRLKRYLSILQTSSPSYVMMAGMEEAVVLMETRGHDLCEEFLTNWDKMLEKLAPCKRLHIYPQKGESKNHDIGKLLISVKETHLTGQDLYDILLEQYHLQMEMAAGTYVLAMFTVSDTEEGYDRLTHALLEIDHGLESTEVKEVETMLQIPQPEQVFELHKAWDFHMEQIELHKSIGHISGEFISVYPPGTPLVVPGERITSEVINLIEHYIYHRLPVQGLIFGTGTVDVFILKE